MAKKKKKIIDENDIFPVEITLESNKENTVLLLKFESEKKIDTHTFIMAIEFYLSDLTRAATQQEQSSSTH